MIGINVIIYSHHMRHTTSQQFRQQYLHHNSNNFAGAAPFRDHHNGIRHCLAAFQGLSHITGCSMPAAVMARQGTFQGIVTHLTKYDLQRLVWHNTTLSVSVHIYKFFRRTINRFAGIFLWLMFLHILTLTVHFCLIQRGKVLIILHD